MKKSRRTAGRPLANRKPLPASKYALLSNMSEENDALRRKNAELTRDLKEALDRQIATTDVLKAISRSTFDLQEVLDTLTEAAARLCSADMASIARQDEAGFYQATNYNFPSDWVEYGRAFRTFAGRGSVSGRALMEGRAVQVADVEADEEYTYREQQTKSGYRTFLAVPLLRNGQPVVLLNLARKTVEPFADKQIELVSTFADQAVIAIENSRLFEEVQARTRELTESLEYQTATSDVLNVISRTPSELQPVFDAIVSTAARLCEADQALLLQLAGGKYYLGAASNADPEHIGYVRDHPLTPDGGSVVGRVALQGQAVHVADCLADPDYRAHPYQQAGNYRTILGVPLLRDGAAIGVLILMRNVVRPFEERQVGLVATFADQAVIAIANTRLFEEVQARTRELSESLQYQTATGEVLNVISRSPSAIQPVLNAIATTANQLCEAHDAVILLREEDWLKPAAHAGSIEIGFERKRIGPGWVTGRAVAEQKPFHIADFTAVAQEYPESQLLNVPLGLRTMLAVPLLRHDEAIGAITLRRTEMRPFSERQVGVLKTFADQAVIAIENARLFEEVQARTRELSESLEFQTATGEVLGVISRSPSRVEPVLDAIVAIAARLCEADHAAAFRLEGDQLRMAASNSSNRAFAEYLAHHSMSVDASSGTGRAVLRRRTIHIPDVSADRELASPVPSLAGVRSILSVPLLRDGTPIGAITLARSVLKQFTERQVALATTFADQAVIAIENARLFEEVQSRTRELQTSLDDLRRAQDRLVQSEKLASLGQLTAGIAHEIKNPLNFVNNFSALSADLVDELKEVLEPAALESKTRQEVDELTAMLKGNLDKVVQHGKRADSIVKNMLLHSREGSGEHRCVDVNALVEESMNLAYHGARAEKPDFDVRLALELDPAAGKVEVYPQETTRVLLNLIGNGFYAANNRKLDVEGSFEPTLLATTRDRGDDVEISIRDNGTGIAKDVRAKMFNPFFTTKPAGEGTGLGLSLAHDIILKHGGRIDIQTQVGQFTEFTLVLPRSGAVLRNSGP